MPFILVPRAGIEPAHLAILDFESSASTNSATEAQLAAETRYPNRDNEIKTGKELVALSCTVDADFK